VILNCCPRSWLDKSIRMNETRLHTLDIHTHEGIYTYGSLLRPPLKIKNIRGQVFSTKNMGVAVYKSIQKAAKQHCITIISTLGQHISFVSHSSHLDFSTPNKKWGVLNIEALTRISHCETYFPGLRRLVYDSKTCLLRTFDALLTQICG
jgi:hypothetical protein